MRELRFALVGCGRIAKRHSDLLGNKIIKNATLSAVCDYNLDKAKQIGEKFNIPSFNDMNTMMREVKPEVVVVLTESGNHAKNVLELTQYDADIVVEKPMALSLKDADKMISKCSERGLNLFVIKQNRYNLPIIKLKEALVKGRFGKLVLGSIRVRWCRDQDYYNQDSWRGTWSLDGGVLTNQASHHLDMLQWMMGEVETVFGMSATRLVNIEAEDTAIATLKFKNGALGSVEATTASRPKDVEGSITIMGEEGFVEVGGFAMNKIKTWDFKKTLEIDKEIMSNYSNNPPNVYGFGHQGFYEDIVNTLLGSTENPLDGNSGKKSLELISAIYESIETGLPVNIGDSYENVKLGKNS